jgi:hypothetical protein
LEVILASPLQNPATATDLINCFKALLIAAGAVSADIEN